MKEKSLFYESMLYSMEGQDPSKAIDDLEKREQKKNITTVRLPRKVNFHGLPEDIRMKGITHDMTYEERKTIVDKNSIEYTKNQYAQMGIKIIEIIDDLLYHVELPEGWKYEPTDHYLWSKVLDEKGRRRMCIMYKGSFYDRDAWVDFYHRYSYDCVPFDDYQQDVTYEERLNHPWKLFLTDCGERIHLICEFTASNSEEFSITREECYNEAKDYLNKNYPDWENINAYWD